MNATSKDKRLIISTAACCVVAIWFAESGNDAAFVITETAAIADSQPAPELAAPAVEAAPQPAEIVCTFRCAACRRAPSLTYHEGDALPAFATCKQCGRSMPRTDPKLSDAERAKLPKAPTAQQSRRVFGTSCRT